MGRRREGKRGEGRGRKGKGGEGRGREGKGEGRGREGKGEGRGREGKEVQVGRWRADRGGPRSKLGTFNLGYFCVKNRKKLRKKAKKKQKKSNKKAKKSKKKAKEKQKKAKGMGLKEGHSPGNGHPLSRLGASRPEAGGWSNRRACPENLFAHPSIHKKLIQEWGFIPN